MELRSMDNGFLLFLPVQNLHPLYYVLQMEFENKAKEIVQKYFLHLTVL